MTDMCIEEALMERLLEILNPDADEGSPEYIPVFGFQSVGAEEKTCAVFNLEHSYMIQDYGGGNPTIVESEGEIIVQSKRPNEIWPTACAIRRGLFNASYPMQWPATGTRRKIHWCRPDKGSKQGVGVDPVLYLDIIRFHLCYDDSPTGIIVDES